jgi:hypothetical protein
MVGRSPQHATSRRNHAGMSVVPFPSGIDPDLTFRAANALFERSRGCETDDQVRAVYRVVRQAGRGSREWGVLHCLSTRALGTYLEKHGLKPGRPKKGGLAHHFLTLAEIGIRDRHEAKEARRVARIPQEIFDAYLAKTKVPTVDGLLRLTEAKDEDVDKPEPRFRVIPPDLLAELAEGYETSDPAPVDHADNPKFDGLTIPWALPPVINIVNSPFREMRRWKDKAEREWKERGCWIKMIVPTYQDRIARELRELVGKENVRTVWVNWLAADDGTPNPVAQACFVFEMRPPQAEARPTVDLSFQSRVSASKRSPGADVTVAQSATGSNCEYWTLKAEFDALGITSDRPFDIDVASPGREFVPWVPAAKHYTRRENGLLQPWYGFIYCNPPHGIDNGVEEWIERFIAHPEGIFLSADWTSAVWWHRLAKGSDAVLFVCPKIQFVKPPWMPEGQNTLGTSLFARGERGLEALRHAERAGRGVLFLLDQHGARRRPREAVVGPYPDVPSFKWGEEVLVDGSRILFSTSCAMANHETFRVAPIGAFVARYLAASTVSIDPFSRNCRWATYTNDLNPNTAAEFHMDAVDFLVLMRQRGVVADLGIFDPPYGPRQVREMYQGFGREVSQGDTQIGAHHRRVRDVMDHLIRPGGVMLSFGWNSNGMGIRRGYAKEEVLLVPHGGTHHDTICVAERKLLNRDGLPLTCLDPDDE